MNKKKSILESNLLYTLIAIVAGFIIGAVFLMIAGISPAVAYGKLIDSVFGKPKYLAWVLTYASPLIFTGLSVAFSFTNRRLQHRSRRTVCSGKPGSLCAGNYLKTSGCYPYSPVPFGGSGSRSALAYLVGLLKVKRGIHEVLSFIMFNWIAFYLSNYVVNIPAIHKEGGGEATKDVAETARILFPEAVRDVLGCKVANWGIILAVAAAVIIWVIIEKTTLGYKLKAVGFNRNGALYGGINSDASVLTALSISGALAGLGGAVQILGMAGRLSQFAGQEGYGFQGITVALIGSSNPIGCIFAGLFYGAMKYGGSKLSIVKAPSEVVDIIMGCVILFIAIAQIFRILFKKLAAKKEAN